MAYGTGALHRQAKAEPEEQRDQDQSSGWRKWSLRLRTGQAPEDEQHRLLGSKLWKEKNGGERDDYTKEEIAAYWEWYEVDPPVVR